MSEPEAPILASEDGAVARLILNRPRAGNSLSMPLVEALRAEFARLATRDDIKVIIVSGMGGRIFSAGHDLNEFAGQTDKDFLERDFAGIAALMQAVVAQPQIVIAKVEGVATAAGLELMLACDLALASTEARFAVPGVNIGFWCHTPQVMLSRAVGRKQAFEMLATARLYPSQHALAIGLINAVHPPEELDRAVEEMASAIASRSGSVLRRGKRSFNHQLELPLSKAYDYVRGEALDNILDADATEGIGAFLGKRDPHWHS